MSKWSLQRKMLSIVFAMVVILVAGIATGRYTINRVQVGGAAYRAIEMTTNKIDDLARLRMNLNLVNGWLYSLMWEYDDDLAEACNTLLHRGRSLIEEAGAGFVAADAAHPITCFSCHVADELSDMMATNEEISRQWQQLQGQVEQILPLLANEEREGAAELLQGDYGDLYGAVMVTTKEQIEAFRMNLEAMRESTIAFSHRIALAYGIGGTCAIVLMLLASLYFVRNLNATVTTVTGELESSVVAFTGKSEHSADAAHKLAEMASELSASLEETAASLEEINSMVQQNDANAHTARQSMRENAVIVNSANDQMQDLQQSMERIKQDSDKIGNILNEIEAIAFQTNLLALNAAVEAARAGEHGQGFAVVAEEVRNLAQRTASSAQNTSALLAVSMENVNTGLAKVEQVAGEFSSITASSKKIEVLVEEIATASHEQAEGVRQINRAITEMDSGTQHLAVNSDQLASTANEILTQTDILRRNIQRLVLLVEGKQAGWTAANAGGETAVGDVPQLSAT